MTTLSPAFAFCFLCRPFDLSLINFCTECVLVCRLVFVRLVDFTVNPKPIVCGGFGQSETRIGTLSVGVLEWSVSSSLHQSSSLSSSSSSKIVLKGLFECSVDGLLPEACVWVVELVAMLRDLEGLFGFVWTEGRFNLCSTIDVFQTIDIIGLIGRRKS